MSKLRLHVCLRLALFWLVASTVHWPEALPGQSLSWVQRDGFREAPLSVNPGGKTGFTLLTQDATGVRFTNGMSYARAEANQNLMNGCGVAAGDFDGDGLCDLYFVSSEGGNGLFRNLGQWRFENTTARAGVGCETQAGKGVVFADINGDGRLDLLMNSLGGPNACFINLGEGRFTNVTAAAGIAAKVGGHSLVLADVDGDGDLDLYMVNYGEFSILRSGGQFSFRNVNGKPVVTGRWSRRLKLIDSRVIELGEPSVLYLNDGRGTFSPVSWTGGAFLDPNGNPLRSEPWDMGLSAMFRDMNGDGAPDLYVCNDFQTPDRIWMNDGRGHFRALADLAVRSTCHFSMGVDFADIDRDGFDDFFVGDMLSVRHDLRMRQVGATNPPAVEVGEVWDRNQVRRNTLNVNRGDGTYADLANFAGVDATDWTWSVAFLDVDLDGYEDLLAVNAHAYDTQDLDMQERAPTAQGSGANRQIGKNLREFPPLITPNVAFRNRGDRTFVETGAEWGFHSTNISHGIALGDYDNDGDLDVAVSCLWQPPLLYRNESTAPRVAVRLKGQAPNTKGIGARIKLLDGAVPTQSQEIQAGGRYLSADEPIRTFAAGSENRDMRLEVVWRSGKISSIRNVRPNYIYEIDEAFARKPETPGSVPPVRPLFRDISSALTNRHVANAFDESQRQVLLYRGLARLGPGVAWVDLDGDGRDELVMAGDLGGKLGVFKFEASGDWKEWKLDGLPSALPADMTGLAAWASPDGHRGLLLGRSTYRPGQDGSGSVFGFALDAAKQSAAKFDAITKVSMEGSSPGPIAVADFDGDGDLDLFVGGRVVPGHYPEAATSTILRYDGAQWTTDSVNASALKKVGLVSGAVWSDLDADGFPELILACEWGPIRVFHNDRGRLLEKTGDMGLAGYTGWWSGVTSGDIDGDGRLDIIASNWGWNSSYHRPSAQQPALLYHGDFDDNGTLDLLETEFEGGRLWPRRNLIALREYMPSLRLRFPTHRQFSEADLATVLDKKFAQARRVEATTLASTVFFNRGTRFEAVPLPAEAQYAPAFAVCVSDLDGDGLEDIFLSQNFFAVRSDEPRLAAGRALWLRGAGKGNLRALSGSESGVTIYGEQRGAAVGDFDGDGRVDLVVGQNDGPTKLFHNASGRPGLRVRLVGPKGNPDGIGATIRLKFKEGFGPIRELHAGSGYWSQDSLCAVLAAPSAPSEIEVRWPGGKTMTSALTDGVREIRFHMDGGIQ